MSNRMAFQTYRIVKGRLRDCLLVRGYALYPSPGFERRLASYTTPLSSGSRTQTRLGSDSGVLDLGGYLNVGAPWPQLALRLSAHAPTFVDTTYNPGCQCLPAPRTQFQ